MARAQPKLMPAWAALDELVFDVMASESGRGRASSLAAVKNAVEDVLEVESLVARLCARYPVV